MDPSADTIFKHKEMLKHRKNCESCPTKVTRKIKFKCQICLSCLGSCTYYVIADGGGVPGP